MVCITLSQEKKNRLFPRFKTPIGELSIESYSITDIVTFRLRPYLTLKSLANPRFKTAISGQKSLLRMREWLHAPLYFSLSHTSKSVTLQSGKKEEWKNEWMNARKKLLFSKHSPAPVFKYLFVWLLKRLSVCVSSFSPFLWDPFVTYFFPYLPSLNRR